MKSPVLLIVILCFFFSSAALAQSKIPPDIRAKMDGYVGVWEYEEATRSTPNGEYETSNGQWEARWVFNYLIEWSGLDAADEVGLIEYESYDSEKQGFAYWFAPNGTRGEGYDGTWNGNTITFQEIRTDPDGSRIRQRCTWPYNSDFTAIDEYKCEWLTDGKWWVSRQGNAKKIKM